MDYLMTGIMIMLGLSILGTFGLVVGVAWYIFQQVKKDAKILTTTESCSWKSKEGIYLTGCGEEFYDASESGNPVTDWLNYCPYCGRKVEEK